MVRTQAKFGIAAMFLSYPVLTASAPPANECRQSFDSRSQSAHLDRKIVSGVGIDDWYTGAELSHFLASPRMISSAFNVAESVLTSFLAWSIRHDPLRRRTTRVTTRALRINYAKT
jgi:hypothetical protein